MKTKKKNCISHTIKEKAVENQSNFFNPCSTSNKLSPSLSLSLISPKERETKMFYMKMKIINIIAINVQK